MNGLAGIMYAMRNCSPEVIANTYNHGWQSDAGFVFIIIVIILSLIVEFITSAKPK